MNDKNNKLDGLIKANGQLKGNTRLEALEDLNRISPTHKVEVTETHMLHGLGQGHMVLGNAQCCLGYYEETSTPVSIIPDYNLLDRLSWLLETVTLKGHCEKLREISFLHFTDFEKLLIGQEFLTLISEKQKYENLLGLFEFWQKTNCINSLKGKFYNQRIIESFRVSKDYTKINLQTLKDVRSKYNKDPGFEEDFIEQYKELLDMDY